MAGHDGAASLTLHLLAEPAALCRLSGGATVPEWTRDASQFLTISRTPTELSIVADEQVVPSSQPAARGYRVLRVEGPLPLHLVGVFVALAAPLAEAGIPIFPIATHDTDYLLVPSAHLPRALAALADAGHVVRADGAAETRPAGRS